MTQTGNRLDVTLADRWRMKHQLGRAGEAHRKTCSTHQDACNTFKNQQRVDMRQCRLFTFRNVFTFQNMNLIAYINKIYKVK